MTRRLTYALGVGLVCLLLIISYYLEIFQHIIPCPLCLMQRFCFALLGILFLIGYFLPNKLLLHKILQSLCFITSLLGIGFAGRNIWLQHFPKIGEECSANLLYMFQTFPFNEFIQKIFIGSTDCSKIAFEFLYLNMAEWAFFWFFIFSAVSIYLISKK